MTATDAAGCALTLLVFAVGWVLVFRLDGWRAATVIVGGILCGVAVLVLAMLGLTSVFEATGWFA